MGGKSHPTAGNGWEDRNGVKTRPAGSCMALAPEAYAGQTALCMKQELTGPKVDKWIAQEREQRKSSRPWASEYDTRVKFWEVILNYRPTLGTSMARVA